MNKGKIIVIEGASDGIGKSTQYNILKKRLISDGNTVATHHFPSYNTFQGKIVENYLNGSYGNIDDLSPYFIHTLYATDRAITWNMNLKKSYENGDIILLDRYTTSSIIYQTSLIEDEEEKKKFIDYVIDFEYNKLGIAKPDHVIFLYAPYETISKLRNNRKTNEGIINDIHEQNNEYMKKVYDNAMFVASYLSWDMIDCSKDNKMLPIDEISNKIYKKIK